LVKNLLAFGHRQPVAGATPREIIKSLSSPGRKRVK
jgi:hypothetical protein